MPLLSARPALLRSPRSSGRSKSRGFTLLELMVVVVIITILAAIAVPGISRQLANRRARSSADFIASLYRNARLRSMARGSAVLVRYTASTGVYEMREAIWGTTAALASDGVTKTNLRNDANCAQLPSASCAGTLWGSSDPGNQLLESFSANVDGEFLITMQNPGAATTDLATLDICFTPTGRAFTAATGGTLLPMTGAARAQVRLASGHGLNRQVIVPPNGVARVNAL